ncbi:BnaA02g30280D [Brassica napus]|uniref:BnaA02g30280D protein n=1 Tax=Brassica napus TaxID=3708 RepID=A0A078IJ47_BRANA|nr:BnaA02g30280D [Brassica napus]
MSFYNLSLGFNCIVHNLHYNP